MLVEFVITGFLAFLIYFLFSNGGPPRYWAKYGIRHIDSTVVASNFDILLGRKGLIQRDDYAYNQIGTGKFCGMLETPDPIILIKDLDLIKKIAIKDFDHFVDRRDFFPVANKKNPMRRMLGMLKGQEWKGVRGHLSPAFTTGKIKRMMDHFNTVGKEWTDMLKSKCKQNPNGSIEVDVMNTVNQYTVDVIGSAVFGMNTGVIKDPEAVFGKKARRLTEVGLIDFIKQNLGPRYPKLFTLTGIEVFDTDSVSFFENILRQSLEARRKDPVQRHDFQELLLEAQKGKLKAASADELSNFENEASLGQSATSQEMTLTDDMLVAQSILFFFAGFASTSTFVTFAAYILAANLDVQEKLQREVDVITKEDKGLDYDALANLTYMEMFVCEVMRHFPLAARLERVCTKEYHDPESGLYVPQNGVVAFPVNSIHHDPKYYSNPETFNPENFSPENKASRSPYAYLPFGIGPRNCIGMRFALIESKAAIAHLLQHFRIEPTSSTPLPVRPRLVGVQIMPPKALKLKLTPR